ncbi:copper resistance protein CopC [Ruania suaedae]|uniref:copper resistance protein CopC n=1 Tax=Ruania suaedae TaxID=2897774 RepID=UPI001E5CC528|nr:copper resistance protein CopC [Ruania suaedae]UFU03386.1 copper resistance protein CopC [Ruania suaedae]
MRSPLDRLPVLAVLVTVIAALALPAAPAAAHSALISSDPEDGTTLESPPAELVLTFNEDVLEMGTSIEVTGPDGAEASDGDPQLDGPAVTQPLTSDLPAGEYSVVWRVVSADGHPIDGELTFTATAGAGEEPPEGSDGETEPADGEQTSEAATPTEDPTGADGDPSGEESATTTAAPDEDPAVAGADGAEGEQDEGPGAGQIALFVVIALAVIGGVAILLIRFRRQG